MNKEYILNVINRVKGVLTKNEVRHLLEAYNAYYELYHLKCGGVYDWEMYKVALSEFDKKEWSVLRDEVEQMLEKEENK